MHSGRQEDALMADFGSIIKQLDELRKEVEKVGPDLAPKVGEIRDALGRLSIEVGEMTVEDRPRVQPPTRPGREIVGGVETQDFPDCCALGDDRGYYCSGTLIAPNVVVTAEHCQGLTRVYLRGTDVTKPDNAEVIPIAEEFVHPELDLRVLVLKHNAATLPRTIGQASQLDGIKEVTLVGFGTIDPDGRFGYGIKRRVDVPIKTFDCGQMGEPKRFGCLPGREIVAGHAGLMLDSCKGDSGGPLYIQRDGEFYLLGATSRGARGGFRECGDGGIYVRVDLCLDWIREVTGAEFAQAA
jgi:hypothetical protein